MSQYPTKQLTNLFNKVDFDGRYNQSSIANFTLIRRRSSCLGIYKIYELIHYGTLIMTVTYFTNNTVIISSECGYSDTDINNMNGLLSLLGIKRIFFYRHNGRIYIRDLKDKQLTSIQLSLDDYHRID